jgi:hypothetical protein
MLLIIRFHDLVLTRQYLVLPNFYFLIFGRIKDLFKRF